MDSEGLNELKLINKRLRTIEKQQEVTNNKLGCVVPMLVVIGFLIIWSAGRILMEL